MVRIDRVLVRRPVSCVFMAMHVAMKVIGTPVICGCRRWNGGRDMFFFFAARKRAPPILFFFTGMPWSDARKRAKPEL